MSTSSTVVVCPKEDREGGREDLSNINIRSLPGATRGSSRTATHPSSSQRIERERKRERECVFTAPSAADKYLLPLTLSTHPRFPRSGRSHLQRGKKGGRNLGISSGMMEATTEDNRA